MRRTKKLNQESRKAGKDDAKPAIECFLRGSCFPDSGFFSVISASLRPFFVLFVPFVVQFLMQPRGMPQVQDALSAMFAGQRRLYGRSA
jgi:hypothetical protein